MTNYFTKFYKDSLQLWGQKKVLILHSYVWKAVLFDFLIWRNVAVTLAHFISDHLTHVFTMVSHLWGSLNTFSIRCMEVCLVELYGLFSFLH